MNRGGSTRGRLAGVVLAWLFVLATLLDSSAARKTVSPEQLEKNMMRSLASGDWPSASTFLESLFTNHPLHPLARLHYGRLVEMAAIQGAGHVERLVAKMKKAMEPRVGQGRGSCLLALTIIQEELLYLHDHERAKEITAELKPVREWSLLGPFPRHGVRDMDNPFIPETIAGVAGKARVKKVVIDGHDGWLRPGRYLPSSRGVVYARTSFTQEGSSLVHVYCRDDYRVFINGRKAGGNTPGLRRSHRIFRVRDSRRVDLLIKKRVTDRDSGLRVIITDDENSVTGARPLSGDHPADNAEVTEVNDFPFDAFNEDSRRDPASAFSRIGMLLHDIGSDEAVEYFQKSLEERHDDIVSYFLAVSLIRRNGYGDRLSGWRVLGRLLRDNPGFVPAGLMRLKTLIDSAEYRSAFRESERLSKITTRSPLLRFEVARLLDKAGRESEFREKILMLKKEFPESIMVAEYEAESLRRSDLTKYLLASRALLEKAWNPRRGRAVARGFLARGDFRAVKKLVERFNGNNDLSREAVEAAIRSGEFESARIAIFKEIMHNDDPWFYEALYRIDTAMDEDPLMYLQKILSIDPSRFDLEDYARYLDSGVVKPPEGTLLDDDDVAAAITEEGHHPMSILYRGRTFLLQADGSSRGFCEDIIRLVDGEGMRKYRESLRRYPDDCIPVRIRVYDERGGATDFRGDPRTGELEGFLGSVHGMSAVIHVAYILENPVPVSREGLSFSFPPEYLQGYNEPAGRVSIRVIAPEEIAVRFSFRETVAVHSTMRDGMRHYAVTMEDLESVDRELHSVHQDAILAYYSFSTMEGPEDYAEWHGWYSDENQRSSMVDARQFKKNDLESTVAAVYSFVAGRGQHPPCEEGMRTSLRDVIRSGNFQADRVRRARELLDALGIKSFPAFTRDRFRSPMKGYMFHEYYTDTLLLVPLDMDHSLWLDFSSPCLPCGMTSDRVDGTEASVMVGTSMQVRNIKSRGESGVRSRYVVRVGEDGSARWAGKTSYSGIHGSVRCAFHDEEKAETIVWRHMDRFFPGSTIDRFRFGNTYDCTRPFVVEAEGSFRVPGISRAGLILRPVAGTSSLHDYASHPRRHSALAIERPVNEVVSCTWELPERFRRAAVSSRRTARASFGTATVEIVKKEGNCSVEVMKSVKVDAGSIGRDNYPEFLEFCRALRRLENEALPLD